MKTPLQVLFVYASLDRAEILVAELRKGGFRPEYVCAGDRNDLGSVIGWAWDVIISDTVMSGITLRDVQSSLTMRKSPPPLIVVTEDTDLNRAVEAMRRGVFDYLEWQGRSRLVEVVDRALEYMNRIQDQAREHKFLRFTQFSIEQAAEAVFWIDSLGRFFYVNDAAGRMLGYAPRELRIMSLFDIDQTLKRSDWPVVWERLRRERSFVAESSLLASGGRQIPVEVIFNMLVLDGEEYTTAYVRDVTERIRVQNALASEEDRYRSLFHNSPISLWEEDLSEVKFFFDELRERGVVDFYGHFGSNKKDLLECVRRVKIIDVNQATVDMLEAQSKDELLSGLERVFTEDSLRVARDEFTLLANGGHRYAGELDHRTFKGRTIRVAVHFNVAPEDRTTLSRVVVSLLDVTERRRMERELERARDGLELRVEERTRELGESNRQLKKEIAERGQVERQLRDSERRHRMIIDTMPVLIHAHDKAGDFMFWNKESERVLGYPAQVAVNTPDFRKRLYPDPEYRAQIVRMHGTSFTDMETDVVTASGEVRTIKWSTVKHASPQPGWESWETGIDVTEANRAETRIHTLTHELMRAQENERRRIALDLHDNVAQNLSSLKISFETLFDGEKGVSPPLQQRAGELSGNLQSCIASVRNLSYDLRPSGLDQLGLVKSLDQFCRELPHGNAVQIVLSSAGMDNLEPDSDIEINLYRLAQEALRNAVRHSRAQTVLVKLVASSPHILMRVEDDGCGFDIPLRRAEAVNDRRMGLQSMEERAKLLDGEFSISSVPGKGTRIFVKVPYKEKLRD
ncbi:MAG: PAS domain S-box protein [Proteobacteria bacterium]|nr:PAS domain S-box protein [Pseudomonadota bacterium]